MLEQLTYLHGQPAVTGVLKAAPSDFVVIEDLGFEPCGEGEHIFVRVRKTGENTAWVAGLLADAAGVNRNAVTWAGLKDRHAVTEQWFGIHLPGKAEPDLSVIESDSIQILEAKRHNRKLRTGYLKGNRFTLRLTGLSGSEGLEARLQAVAEQGVPNYYGEQRFGRGGNNLEAAKAMFGGKRIKDRNKRSLYLSAARSMLFNTVVTARIEQGLAHTLLAGDCLMLKGSHSIFSEPEVTPELAARLASGDVQLTAPLWGRGRLASQHEAAAFEEAALSSLAEWREGLEKAGLDQERRPLLLRPEAMSWQLEDDTLTLSFFLPAGAFATSVVRELIDAREADHHGEAHAHSGE
ncbi:tRNA pseudouridine(13) synthase TruD [Aeromonas diversa]|uniref:tRNA pseudouridine(13) synthase TruD n=1 Tax=Aeromonas diversa TaxID=502790 RepID=UPI003461DB01